MVELDADGCLSNVDRIGTTIITEIPVKNNIDLTTPTLARKGCHGRVDLDPVIDSLLVTLYFITCSVVFGCLLLSSSLPALTSSPNNECYITIPIYVVSSFTAMSSVELE